MQRQRTTIDKRAGFAAVLILSACGGQVELGRDLSAISRDAGGSGSHRDAASHPPPDPADTGAAATDSGVAAAPDASPLADSGTTYDAGLQRDSGSSAGTPDSGAPLPDAGLAPDAGGSSPDAGSAGGAPFGGTCVADGDCQSGLICRTFGQLGNVCTKTCVTNADCPAGSQGQRCNQMGLCRP